MGRVILALVVVVVVAVAAYGTYVYLSTRSSGTTLIVYSYASLLGGSNCNPAVWSEVFGAFESLHHVTIQLECPTGNLASTLVAQKNAPGADVVIGLDEITATQADQAGVLIPYTSPQLVNVAPVLIPEISPDHAVTPYEYGYLAIDYNASFAAQTHGTIAHSAFPNFVENQSWARQLLIEDPTLDITGEEFLVWQIEFYSQVLHQDWRTFWSTIDPSLPPAAPDWGTAFGEFTAGPTSPQLVVSYASDPAYAAANGAAGAYSSTVSTWNGTLFGWKTIYGAGIVQGSQHLGLDEALIDWLLSGTVQTLIPTNEWEWPANATVPLPSVYSSTIPPASVVALNDGTSPSSVASQIPAWLNEWQTLANA